MPGSFNIHALNSLMHVPHGAFRLGAALEIAALDRKPRGSFTAAQIERHMAVHACSRSDLNNLIEAGWIRVTGKKFHIVKYGHRHPRQVWPKPKPAAKLATSGLLEKPFVTQDPTPLKLRPDSSRIIRSRSGGRPMAAKA